MAMDEAEMRKRIFAIMTDTTLTEAEKAVKRQELMCGKWMAPTKEANSHDSGAGDGEMMPGMCVSSAWDPGQAGSGPVLASKGPRKSFAPDLAISPCIAPLTLALAPHPPPPALPSAADLIDDTRNKTRMPTKQATPTRRSRRAAPRQRPPTPRRRSRRCSTTRSSAPSASTCASAPSR